MGSRLLLWIRTLLLLLRSAFRDFLPILRELIGDLLKRWRKRQEEKRLPERDKRATPKKCVPIDSPAYKKPDPLIYSQKYLMKQGLAVTWDNPDIQLYKNGTPISSSQLEVDTEYDIIARIWNNSTDAPVVDLPVRFFYRSFGVGTQLHLIGDTRVTLGVKGGANHPAFAAMKWHTPKTAGHYCIQVLLEWIDDANPDNNLGQENTNVYALHSSAHFSFVLRNDTHEIKRYRFTVDAYRIPSLPPCSSDELQPEDLRQQLKVHQASNYPVPDGWDIVIVPDKPELAPAEERTVEVTVNVPDAFQGRQSINMNAFNGAGLAGGVTVYIERR